MLKKPMLHDDYRTPKMERKEWPLIPEDMYQVAIEDITSVEAPVYNKPDEKEEVFNFQFVILEDGEYKGQRLFKRVRPIVFDGAKNNRPSWLYQIFKAAMKKEPTAEQCEFGLTGKELNELIGKQVRVSVKHSSPNAKGRIYSNIEGVMHAKVDMELPKLKTKAPGETKEPTGEQPIIESENNEVDPNDLPF